jgi:hypothetical protein
MSIEPDLWYPSREKAMRMQLLVHPELAKPFLDATVYVHLSSIDPDSMGEEDGYPITESDIARKIIKDFAAPGESVIVQQIRGQKPDAIPATLSKLDAVFEVTQLHLFYEPSGVLGFYRFKNKLGYYNMLRFENTPASKPYFGVTGSRDGVLVFLPFDDLSKPDHSRVEWNDMVPCGPAIRLDAPLHRHARDAWNLNDPLLDRIGKRREVFGPTSNEKEIIKGLEDPTIGEVQICQYEDGRYGLVSVPWSSGVSDRERAFFKEACGVVF